MAFRFSLHGPSYRDAVRLLAHDEPTIVKIIDRLGGAALAAASGGTLDTLAFFDVRDELVRWGNDVVRTIRDRISGLSRFDRTQRLVAAHSVIVITSFYEALGELLDAPGNPISLRDFELTEEERLAILSSGATAGVDFEGLRCGPARWWGTDQVAIQGDALGRHGWADPQEVGNV